MRIMKVKTETAVTNSSELQEVCDDGSVVDQV